MSSRGNWGTRLGFVLAAAGSAVGLGNLWKFPYITYDNNGGTFVLVYLICISIVGLPIMIAEIMIGRSTQKNAVGAFKALFPQQWIWQIIGWLGIATGFIILSYYSVVAGWTLEYTLRSLTGYFSGLGPDVIASSFGEFLADPVRQVGWHAVFMFITAAVVFGGISKGIERWTKVLVPLLFAILLVLMVYSLTTGAGKKAIAFIFNFSSPISTHGMLEALGHAFFTLSLGMGAMLTYGSYLRKDTDIGKAAFTVTVLDTLVALVACLVMYPIIFANPDLQITESIGIIFTTLPYIFQSIPLGNIFSPLFFALMAFAALTSTISLLEVVVSYTVDELKWQRHRSVIVVSFVIFLFGIPSALSYGAVDWISSITLLSKGDAALNWFDSFDYLASNWLLPIGGMLIAFFAGWIMKVELKKAEILQGEGFKLINYGVWNFLIKFVSPVAVLLVLLYKIGIIKL